MGKGEVGGCTNLWDFICIFVQPQSHHIALLWYWFANSMAVSELSFEKTLVGTGWAISVLLCINGLRKQSSHLVGPHS